MTFIDDILNYDSLSIVGLQKNTGKTVSLNYVLDRLPVERKRIAVTSIGIDGETTDQVTRTQKPEIYLRQGMYFGTSEMHYRQKRIVSELIDVSDENTSLGMKDMHRVGIELVIIDGALSRMSLASPAVSQSMILATGAAYSTNMNTLVQQTAFVVDLIKIPLTEEANLNLLMPIEKGVWYIDDEGALHELSNISSLSQDFRFEGMDRCKTLYVAGALVDGFLEKVRKNPKLKTTELVVRDFTKIFVSPQQYRMFLKTGGTLRVLQKRTSRPQAQYAIERPHRIALRPALHVRATRTASGLYAPLVAQPADDADRGGDCPNLRRTASFCGVHRADRHTLY